MKKRTKIILAISVIALACAGYGYKQYMRKNTDLAYARPDLQMTSAELIKTFEADEKLANAKYLDKIIAVSGTVKEISKDEKGYYTVVLGEANSMSNVRCSMDTAHQQKISLIKPGSAVTIKGACTGFNADELLGSDVILNRGVVSDKN